MRKVLTILLAGAIGALGAPAMAQNSGGVTSLPPPPPPTDNPHAGASFDADYYSAKARASRVSFLGNEGEQAHNWDNAAKFGACSVSMNPDRARQLLDQQRADYTGKPLELGKYLNRNQGCVTFRTALDRDFLRGGVAESLILSQGTDFVIPPAGGAAEVGAFIKAVKAPGASKDDPFSMGQFEAECRTALAPVGARALIATTPGSTEEAQALSGWRAVTQPCDGFSVEGTAMPVRFARAYAAQALYHWAAFARGKD